MKLMIKCKGYIILFALLLMAGQISASKLIKPAEKGNTSFVVIIDSVTYSRCAAQVNLYKQTLEKEGLPTFIACENWNSPQQIRELLQKLYKQEKLEGAVFIGDIPIPMITKAQHLTSAFKMDERGYPLRQVSVPSDRYYEDFDLQFIALKDSTQGNKYYFQLAPQSPQYISCDIYSGRIQAQASNGDKYKQIADYLIKAVKAHRQNNPLDQFVSYAGEGSCSNSLVAWRAEQQTINEQFPGVFTKQHNMKFLRYSMAPYMKESVCRELRRKDLDMMIFHEHGMPYRQYLTGVPQFDSGDDEGNLELVKSQLREMVRRDKEKADPMEKAKKEADLIGVDSSWFSNAFDPLMIAKDSLEDLQRGIILEDVNLIAPNVRFVIFDACYNGDFREDDYIAGKYIFSSGNCVAAFANSVNVLQDKSTFDLMGLLDCGMRIGLWAQNINILESHIHGDPTFRFTPNVHVDINTMAKNNSSKFWLSQLNAPQADLQNYALIKLYRNNYKGISDLLYKKYRQSPYAVVRYNCLHLLESINDENYRKALTEAPSDSFEFIRRIGCHRMGMCGDEMFIPYLIDAYVNDQNSARVIFNIEQSLLCFDKDQVLKVIERKFADANYFNAQNYKAKLIKLVEANPAAESLQTIANKGEKDRWRKFSIAFLKNRPYHQIVSGVVKELEDPANSDYVRIQIAEAFAWFVHSVNKPEIIASCHKLISEGECSQELTQELQRACTRLESAK